MQYSLINIKDKIICFFFYFCRYTGGLVPDVYQIFVRGNGIFTNLPSKSNPEKLR